MIRRRKAPGFDQSADSYAVVELIKGNSKYAPYSNEPVKICIFNLAEIYWFALNEYGEEIANKIFGELKGCILNIDDEILKHAIKFRKQVYKNKKVSYADAIGYVYALRNNMVFLTGDKEFENLDNVEFTSK